MANHQSQKKKHKSKQHKVIRYRRSRFKDPGVLLFLGLALYLSFYVAVYLSRPHVTTYAVTDGSIATDYSYTGIAVRKEQTVSAEVAGFITYYARELERVGARTNIFSLDETGQLSSILSEENMSQATLSKENLAQLMEDVNHFITGYSDMNYASTYQFKQEAESMTVQLIQQSLVENAALLDSSAAFHLYQSPLDGILSYRLDQYENLSVQDVKAEMLEKADEYSYQNLQEQKQIAPGDLVYKVIMEDQWSVVIETDAETARKLVDEKAVEVTFKKDKISVWGQTDSWNDGDKTLVSFTFTNSMIRYAQDRFLDISFELDGITGLKAPNSAVAERELFSIPKEFLEYSENGKRGSVYYETFNSNGEAECQKLELDIAYETDENVFINKEGALGAGSMLIKPNSQERYTIGKTEKWIGVYNYNKGYAVFCPINILYQGKEYCIIESQTKYGLAKYDYIVLDSSALEEESEK